MSHRSRPLRIALPPLSDQAAVDVLEFLHHAVECFESRYFGQIHRYYRERRDHPVRQRSAPPCSDDDVPF